MVPLFQRRKEEEIVTFLPTENVKVTNRFCQLYPDNLELRLSAVVLHGAVLRAVETEQGGDAAGTAFARKRGLRFCRLVAH